MAIRMKYKTYTWYRNVSTEDIVVNQIVYHGNQIIGVACEEIAKGKFGLVQTGGTVIVNVGKGNDWYDENNLDSILGLE